MAHSGSLSNVESKVLERGSYEFRYEPDEKMGVLIAESFPVLGTMTAARFLEWVQANPEGVVSLPTGKSPQYFIEEVNRFLSGWNSADGISELEYWGVDPSMKPEMRGLQFVQIDEFYPINPAHHNSFHYYVNKYYLEGFGIGRDRALLIDCEQIGLPKGMDLEDVWGDEGVDLSLRYRSPRDRRERIRKDVIAGIDQWCTEYEDKIRELGGIGFFLGGIGPDGHIGFNMRGSDMYSTTRLSETNYETQAAAASDLGGIEVARKRLVITIGLPTITANADCVAIIIAAGEAKAKIVAGAIQKRRNREYPATVLQSLPNARFYLTDGAAHGLTARRLSTISRFEEVPDRDLERIVVDLSIDLDKEIMKLTADDYRGSQFGAFVLERTGKKPATLNRMVADSLKEKIKRGMTIDTDTRFLHTEPHHDDIMLGYLPLVVRHIREHSNYHHFATLTSGFTAVTNAYMLDLCLRMKHELETDSLGFNNRLERGYFDPQDLHYRDRDVWKYLEGVAEDSEEAMEEGGLRRLLRNLIEVFDESDLENLLDRVNELINYFETQYPGKRDLPHIQKLKGMCREWESACLWGYFGWNHSSIEHLRLGFYQGRIFTEDPTFIRDVIPVLDLMRRVKPDVITVAMDPEASGPDTHYKTMQAVSQALKQYQEETGRDDIEVLGYRNVWYRFHPSEADVCVPVSLNMFSLQKSSFMNTYVSQRNASFPSYEYDGPFPDLAQQIQVDQYTAMLTCLGKEFFYDHPSALIRATRGLVFVRRMDADEFFRLSEELRVLTESTSGSPAESNAGADTDESHS